jgi:hypothetical protein
MSETGSIRLRRERQLNPVADEVLALVALVRPIISGILYAIKRDIMQEAGGYENVSLQMLSRLYNRGDGDCGICFEWAVHDAIKRNDPKVVGRVADAMRLCRVPGSTTQSILFGAEKSGALNLIDTASDVLTDGSRVLTGIQAQPPFLKRRIKTIAGAFSNPRTRLALPWSISGLWKADLFVGCADSERWVGTTVKNNVDRLEAAQGLRIGIVPTQQGKTDKVRRDETRNMVICPLLYDGDFMQTFYEGWQIVQALMTAKMALPSEAAIPRPASRQVAKILVDRGKYPAVEVVEALESFAQPELLHTDETSVSLEPLTTRTRPQAPGLLVTPVSRVVVHRP